jgi:hypothetical protein
MRSRVDQAAGSIQSDFRMNPWQNHKLTGNGSNAGPNDWRTQINLTAKLLWKYIQINMIPKWPATFWLHMGRKATLHH